MPNNDIFVAYARVHRALVAPLVELLKLDDRKVFLDETIAPGADWEVTILDSLSKAKIVVVVWCSHARKSRWVRRELNVAATLNKLLIPVRLDTTRLPIELSRFQAIDFSDIYPHVTMFRKFLALSFKSFLFMCIFIISEAVRDLDWQGLVARAESFQATIEHRAPRMTHDYCGYELTADIILWCSALFLITMLIFRFKRRRLAKAVGLELAKKVMDQINRIEGEKEGVLDPTT
jgi:hypothetical protein